MEGWAAGQGAELGAAGTQALSVSCCGPVLQMWSYRKPRSCERWAWSPPCAVLWAWMLSLPLGPLAVSLLLLVQHRGGLLLQPVGLVGDDCSLQMFKHPSSQRRQLQKAVQGWDRCVC